MIPNYYSCQYCFRIFESEEQVIIPNLYPVCSFKCKLGLIHSLIDRFYNNEDLEFMHKTLKKNPSNYEFKRNIAIYELTKYYSKFPLSSVISVYSFLILNSHYSNNVSITHFSHFSPPLYDKGVSEKGCLSNNEKGGLSKWS